MSTPMQGSPDPQWRPPSGPAHDGMQMPPPQPGSYRTVLIDEPAPADVSRRGPGKGLIIAIIAVALVGLALLVADWVSRNVEMNQLLTQIEKSEAAMGEAQDAIAAVNLSEGESPLDEGALDKAAAQLEAAAAEGRDAVAQAGQGVADVSFLPWHTSLIEAQSAYLDHNQAWVNYLDAGARNAGSLANSPLDIETTWRIAEVRVREAVPFVPFPGINARVDKIFTDGSAEDSGDTIDA